MSTSLQPVPIRTEKQRLAVLKNLQGVIDNGGNVYLWHRDRAYLVHSVVFEKESVKVHLVVGMYGYFRVFPTDRETCRLGRSLKSKARIVLDGDRPCIAFGERGCNQEMKERYMPVR